MVAMSDTNEETRRGLDEGRAHHVELNRLADLIRQMNRTGSEIAALIGRPALQGHVGEFIASRIFDIELETSATQRALDGHFRSGALAGRSVNVKWYGKRENLLDLAQSDGPDFYLVLAGPPAPPVSSRGQVRPWCIESVHLFEHAPLVAGLRRAGVKIGIATSVRKDLWAPAQLYPEQRSPLLVLTAEQRGSLELFAPSRIA
jgi:hypothetical protein